MFKLPERCVKLHFLLSHVLDALAEALESHLQFVAQFSLALLGGQVVTVVHVLMLPQIRGYLAHLRVELHVDVLLFTCDISGLVIKGLCRSTDLCHQ